MLLAGEPRNVIRDDGQTTLAGQLDIKRPHFIPRISAREGRNATDCIGAYATGMFGKFKDLCGLDRPNVDDDPAAAFGQPHDDFDNLFANLEIEIDAFARTSRDIKPSDAFL